MHNFFFEQKLVYRSGNTGGRDTKPTPPAAPDSSDTTRRGPRTAAENRRQRRQVLKGHESARAKLARLTLQGGSKTPTTTPEATGRGPRITSLPEAAIKKLLTYMGSPAQSVREGHRRDAASATAFELRSAGILRQLIDSETDPAKKAALKRKLKLKKYQGYKQIANMFTDKKKDQQGRTYLEVNFHGNDTAKWKVGLAHLVPPTVTEITVIDTSGKARKGSRQIKNGRVGYYDAQGYIEVFDGYKIYFSAVTTATAAASSVQSEAQFYERRRNMKPSASASRRPWTRQVDTVPGGVYRKVAGIDASQRNESWNLNYIRNTEKATKIEYKKQAMKMCKEICNEPRFRGKINWRVMLAQSILETGWGTSKICRATKNFFGMKAHEVRGQMYRQYKTTKECFYDYANKMLSMPRYSKSLQYPNNQMMSLALILANGYCTDPGYFKKVLGVWQYGKYGQAIGLGAGSYIYEQKLRDTLHASTTFKIPNCPTRAARDAWITREFVEPARRAGRLRA